jgi:Transcriptional regulatory protein, C terminal
MILEILSKAKWVFFLAIAPLLTWFTQTNSQTNTSQPDPSTVNLALRRAADQVLRLSGDSLSRIPAVEQKAATTWQLRLDASFQYALLATILDSAFLVYKINMGYEVAVRNCSDSLIVLGYHHLDVKRSKVPCGDREAEDSCKFIEIRFHSPINTNGTKPIWPYVLYASSLLILFVGKAYWRKSSATPQVAVSEQEKAWVSLGNSRLDPIRQILDINGYTQKLTYREAKLLAFFAEHQNQLVDRDLILQSVWADEGILVSRSVDMFVSRLRKKLSADQGLRIVAVHGVGYRFEVDRLV